MEQKVTLGLHSVYTDSSADVDVLIVPSHFQRTGEVVEGMIFHEERQLFNLFLLKHPLKRVFYVTSMPINPRLKRYYFDLLSQFCHISRTDARKRVTFITLQDYSAKPLAQKIVEKPKLLQRLKSVLRSQKSVMLCYSVTKSEATIAQILSIPLLAVKPSQLHFSTKSGSKKIFQQCNIPNPRSTPHCDDAMTLAEEVVELLITHKPYPWELDTNTSSPSLISINNSIVSPSPIKGVTVGKGSAAMTSSTTTTISQGGWMPQFVVKLEEGFSGKGNALLSLKNLPSIPRTEQGWKQLSKDNKQQLQRLILQQFSTMKFQGSGELWEDYNKKIKTEGVIAEYFLEGRGKTSPSVQCYIDADGTVKVISTHEQILGGPDGQVFMGCKFPAKEIYRSKLQEFGVRVGNYLASQNIRDHFSVDFVAVPSKWTLSQVDPVAYELFAVEINIRQGGTTHPRFLLELLTAGKYDENSGLYKTLTNQSKFYVSSDTLVHPRYKSLAVEDILELFANANLLFEPKRQTGVIFHMLGSLGQFGKIGAMCVGNSEAEAQFLFEKTVSLLNRECKVDSLMRAKM